MPSESTSARMKDASPNDDDRQFDLTLRPTRIEEYIGQRQVKENLRVYMKAALRRREALDHVLLTGPPGLGKTTLANIIANEMGAELRSTAGPAIEKAGDIAALLNLGYQRVSAEKALDNAIAEGGELTVETVLRRVLRKLARV